MCRRRSISLKTLSFVVESSGGRVMRYAHNVERVLSDSVAGGRADRRIDAARTANRRRAADQLRIACIASPTRRPSKDSCRSLPPGPPARSRSNCRASPARAKRAGLHLLSGAPSIETPAPEQRTSRGGRPAPRRQSLQRSGERRAARDRSRRVAAGGCESLDAGRYFRSS